MVAKGMKRGRAYLYHFLNILWTSLISVNRKKNVQNESTKIDDMNVFHIQYPDATKKTQQIDRVIYVPYSKAG